VAVIHKVLIEEAIAQALDTTPFSGVVAVDRAGEEVLSRAYGFANRADAILNTCNTRFAQASGSKTFTAAAVCRLVEEGHITFDARMVDHLECWPSNFDTGVTVHHLLTHTSGVPDYFDEEVDDDFEALWARLPTYQVRTRGDVFPLFADQPMKFSPGERFSYCNSGFILLGLMIEQHAEQPFADYVEAEVFAPAGMNDSGYFAFDRLPPCTASNYLTDEGPDNPRTNVFTVPAVGQPDGGAFVTAPDMARFWSALRNHRLLNPPTTEQMLRAHATTGRGEDHYGYGVWIEARTSGSVIHRAEGMDPGVSFVSDMWTADDVSITVISNTDGSAWPIYRAITGAVAEG
jgi:CubicO group peptidase (beta-lactamase class C family)